MTLHDKTTDERIIDEAGAYVRMTLQGPSWLQRHRIRRFIRRSPIHAREFLVTFLFCERIRGLSPHRTMDIETLLEEAEKTVVPLSIDDAGNSNQSPRGGNGHVPRSRLARDHRRGLRIARRSAPFSLRTAISLLLLPLLPTLAPTAPLPAMSKFVTSANEFRTVTLESGSTIYLNELTSITVAHNWTGYKVQLLGGDAFFDIRHNTHRPVSVSLGPVLIDHVGTRFDVRRLQDQATVSVLEGEVSITDTAAHANRTEATNTPSIAHAGMQISINDIQSLPRLSMLPLPVHELEYDSAWIRGWLEFNGETFGEVARAFNA